MINKVHYISVFVCMFFFGHTTQAENPPSLSPFGTKTIQLSIGPNGVTQNKTPGFICDLTASLGGAQYSEWGESEEDARTIVHQKCSGASGLLLCKKDKITCKQDK